MSSALAIAAVTQVLKEQLNDAFTQQGVQDISPLSAGVTCWPPDRISTGGNEEANNLNLFMYMTSPNSGWRNQHYPAFNAKGKRISSPPLAVDLHYILSAYGSGQLHSEVLLGYGMLALHQMPVLTRSMIRDLLNPAEGEELPPELLELKLFTAGLEDQFEQIKISPETVNTEEASRLWTAFGAKYRPSAFYKVTVVLIEKQQVVETALPVRDYRIHTRQFQRPVVQQLKAQDSDGNPVSANQKILPGYRLVIEGDQFSGEAVSLQIGSAVQKDFLELSDQRIIATIPSDVQAGIKSVQVVHQFDFGEDSGLHKGFISNAEAFVLSPEVKVDSINIQTTQIDNTSARFLVLEATPGAGDRQSISLLLNQTPVQDSTSELLSYDIKRLQNYPASMQLNEGSLIFPINQVENGNYRLRLRIDKAESPMVENISIE